MLTIISIISLLVVLILIVVVLILTAVNAWFSSEPSPKPIKRRYIIMIHKQPAWKIEYSDGTHKIEPTSWSDADTNG